MSDPRVLAIVLAGGKGSRMEVLTEARAKPTLSFGGVFRLIDITMSNLRNSRLDDVWVVLQYHSTTVDDALAHGRPWDLDRTFGGLRVLQPQEGLGDDEDGMASGNSDALFRFRGLIEEFDPDLVLVLSADHVYRMDYRHVIAEHLRSQAECTIVTTSFDVAEADNHTLIHAQGDGDEPMRRVTRINHKPEDADTDTVATEVFCYDARVLLSTLEELFERLPADETLGDFGEDLLPELVKRGRTYALDHPGYWRDLGRPAAYLAAHHDLLMGVVDVFDHPEWPMLTATPARPGTRISEQASVTHSMIAGGCGIDGTVTNSVLGHDVIVEDGAQVTDSVLMNGVIVRAGAKVGWSIVAADVTIGTQARVGTMTRPASDDRVRSDDLTVIGQGARIDGHVVVDKGTRVGSGGRRRRS